MFVLLNPGCKRKRGLKKSVTVNYAHRGLHGGGVPENSLTAYKLAVESGYGIELDVQLSRDGEVMVMHDYSLERMTGDKRKLSEVDAYELDTLRLSVTDEKIPRFSEVLNLVGGRVPLLVELKGEHPDCSLCPKVNEMLSSYYGDYIIESFNPILLSWFRKNNPLIVRGILTTKICNGKGKNIVNALIQIMALNFMARPDFIAYDGRYKRLPVSICTKLFRLPAFVWTVRTESEREQINDKNTNIIFENIRP